MASVKLVIEIDEAQKKMVDAIMELPPQIENDLISAIRHGTPLTSDKLADLLMEERIRGELKSDTYIVKDIIPGVRCKLTVSIKDNRPCYCGAGLKEVWRESEG